MTSPEDDLRDLIAELDGLHWPEKKQDIVPIWVENEYGMPEQRSDLKDITTCSDCVDSWGNSIPWPCPTGEIVDKYKRRAHRRRYVVTASADRNFAWGTGQPPTEYSVTIKPAGNTVHRADTPDQCETWIEQQYEENE